ncbi:MAG: VOC family protein [Pseudomonadota bacterium]
MAKLAHSMIRVRDEARSLAYYADAFGLTVKDRLDFDSFTLIYLVAEEGAFELELTVNKGQEAAYDLGDGYGHLALIVDDLEARHAAMQAAGHPVRDIVDFKPGGTRVARFFFATDPDGYQIEVLERGGRFQ